MHDPISYWTLIIFIACISNIPIQAQQLRPHKGGFLHLAVQKMGRYRALIKVVCLSLCLSTHKKCRILYIW